MCVYIYRYIYRYRYIYIYTLSEEKWRFLMVLRRLSFIVVKL